MNFFFDFPYALVLLALVPAYWVWYLRYYAPRRLRIRLSYDPAQWTENPRRWLLYARWAPPVLLSLALAAMIIALARPQKADHFVENQSEGVDLMLCFDVSGSMETQDFLPNRLEVARQVAANFVDGRENDRIGLVVFAEDAFTYAPLTLDHAFIRSQLAEISPKLMPKQGTALGTALAVSINRLAENPKRSKAIILLTDGAGNAGKLAPVDASQLAAEKKIKIYSIGVGKEEYRRKLPNGKTEIVKTDLDEAALRAIALNTGGAFFRATDRQSLDNIFRRISQLETKETSGTVYRRVEDLYPLFLFVAVGAMLLAFGLMYLKLYNPLEE